MPGSAISNAEIADSGVSFAYIWWKGRALVRLRSCPKFAKKECRIKVDCTKEQGQPGHMMGQESQHGGGFLVASFFGPKVVFSTCGCKCFWARERRPTELRHRRVARTHACSLSKKVSWRVSWAQGSVNERTQVYPSIVTEGSRMGSCIFQKYGECDCDPIWWSGCHKTPGNIQNGCAVCYFYLNKQLCS